MSRGGGFAERERERSCDLCRRSYYRRTLTETWDRQNPGSRLGWHKATLRVCTHCLPQNRAQRLLVLASVQPLQGGRLRRSKAS